MEPIAIRGSQRLALVGALAGLSAVVAVLCVTLIPHESTSESDILVAGSWGLFFAAGTIFLLFRAFSARPLMVLSDEGIVDHRLKIGPIPWSELEGADVQGVLGLSYVNFRLRDGSAVLEDVPAWRRRVFASNREIGGTEWTINVTGTGVSAQAVIDAVNRQVALHRGAGRAAAE